MIHGGEEAGEIAATASTYGSNAAAKSPDRRPRAVIALYWTCGALFVLLVVLSLFMAGPQVESDEGSYLLNAAAIAGRLAANPPNGYYSGYSLLLAPGFLFDAGPERAYHFALVVNALLVASIPLALYRLTRQLWPDSGSDAAHVTAALAATCYAPMLMLSQHTMSESALACAFAWLLACTTTTLRTARMSTALIAGAFAGFLFLVHARGATMAAPILLATIVHAIFHPRSRRAVTVLWLTAIVVMMLHDPLEVAAGRSHASSTGMLREMLSRFALAGNWKWLPLNFVGSATEAIVTSLGIAVVAACAVGCEMRLAWFSRERLPIRVTILAASAIAMLVAMGVTAVFFSPPERADQLAYGRYALPALIPLLAFGLLRLIVHAALRKRDFFWAAVVGIASLAITSAAYLSLSPGARTNWNFVNSIGLHLFHDVAFQDAPWLSIALCFVTLLTISWLAFLRSGFVGATLHAALQLALFATAWSTITWPGSRSYATDRGVIDAARKFSDAGGHICVQLAPDVDSWHRTDVTWRLFPQMAKAPAKDCIDATIGLLKDKHGHDQHLVVFERASPLGNNGSIGLFLRAGADFENFTRLVAALPDDVLQPTPAEDRLADVVILDPSPLHATLDEPMDLHIRIINRGKRRLPIVGGAQFLPHPTLIGAQVELGETHLEYRAEIPQTIEPGDAANAVIRIGPFDEARLYTLRVGVLQEAVAWYQGAAHTTFEVSAR